MWSKLVIALLPYALKIIDYFIDKNDVESEIRINWIKMKIAFTEKHGVPAQMSADYESLDDELDALEKKYANKEK